MTRRNALLRCTCGGASTARPSGDRVCEVCGKVWTVTAKKPEMPRP